VKYHFLAGTGSRAGEVLLDIHLESGGGSVVGGIELHRELLRRVEHIQDTPDRDGVIVRKHQGVLCVGGDRSG